MDGTMQQIDKEWETLFNKNELESINDFLEEEYVQFEGIAKIFPPKSLIFNAFSFFKPSACKVVILGQDPYHGENQAMGLSFSVPDAVKLPPSLKNIFKEIMIDSNSNSEKVVTQLPTSGDLTYLSKQGVLLLNRALTVRQAKPNSHSKIWHRFTKEIIEQLFYNQSNIVFMLWGNDAKSVAKNIHTNILDKHLILTAVHPSPLSANRGGWFGTNHFNKANEYLRQHNVDEIHWID